MNFITCLLLFHLLLIFSFQWKLKMKFVIFFFFFSCFSYGWYFTFIQGFVYLFLIYLNGFTSKQMVNPWKTYVKLSAVLMGSHGLTKGSLAFLNYPAQIMFKSTKVTEKKKRKHLLLLYPFLKDNVLDRFCLKHMESLCLLFVLTSIFGQ